MTKQASTNESATGGTSTSQGNVTQVSTSWSPAKPKITISSAKKAEKQASKASPWVPPIVVLRNENILPELEAAIVAMMKISVKEKDMQNPAELAERVKLNMDVALNNAKRYRSRGNWHVIIGRDFISCHSHEQMLLMQCLHYSILVFYA